MTVPFLLREYALLIEPTEQRAARIRRFAAASVLRFSLGTTHPRGGGGGGLALAVKAAVAERGAVMVSVHVPVPEHAPDQPVKLEPAAGTAVSVTSVPLRKSCAQVAPQSMPAGLELMVPAPLPILSTLRVKGRRAKVAVADRSSLIVSVHVPVPEHAPDHPVNVEPLPAVVVSVTDVPCSKACAQVVPQSIPAGLDVTVPFPAPALLTVSVFGASAKRAVTE
jgi:hypothetical protein